MKQEIHPIILTQTARILTTSIRGGALYYAIFIMLLLSMMGVMLISYFQLTHREDTLFYKKAELDDQLASAIILVSSQPSLLPVGTTKEMDPFEDGLSTVQMNMSRWGFLRKLEASAHWRQLSSRQTLLMAEQEAERIALWMPDKKRYVSLVGKSYINGDCCLSELGVRKGNAEGRYFEGPYLHRGVLKPSGSALPPLNKDLLAFVDRYKRGQYDKQDSLIGFQTLKESDRLNQAFDDKTLIIQASSRLSLDKGQYTNNIILFSADTIELWPSVQLDRVIVMASTVIFKQGFKGRIQALASRSVIIEKGCQLLYPSYVGVTSQTENAHISIQEGSTVNGGVLCYAQRAEEGKTSILIDKAKVIGKCYVNGDISMQGTIHGSLFCDRFVYLSSRAFYENFMIDASIDEKQLPKQYASFCVDKNTYQLQEVARW